jgi:2-haloacid dehalogenase
MVLAFDIYGTLIDPFSIESALEPIFGAKSREATELWRTKQLEYAIRRALMLRYVTFNVCTEQALTFTARRFGIVLSEQQRADLLARYRKLPAYPDVASALAKLSSKLVAFSNGTDDAVRDLLEHSGILNRFADIVSVDGVHSFKPDPAVYDYLARRLAEPKDQIWLVSSNPFDVIGAKSAGLHAVWLKRDATRIFDPWEIEPDRTIHSLSELENL